MILVTIDLTLHLPTASAGYIDERHAMGVTRDS